MAYTNIDDPSAYFQATTYTGAGANTVVTNGGNSDLKPDFLWIKNRTAGYASFIVDSNRNISYAQNSSNAPYLESNATGVENNNQNWMQSVNTDGFTTGISEHINSNSGSAFVAWQWKANGGTTASNTSGTITSTVQANQDAGFSIVTYTGNGSNATIGHGLGEAPKVVIVRARSRISSWVVFHGAFSSDDAYMVLQTTAGAVSQTGLWNNQYPSSTVFGASSDLWLNANGSTYVAYCFAEKQGYSKFGTYYGNGNTDGEFIYTGFKPALVITKVVSDPNYGWVMADNARGPFNENDPSVYANSSAAETTNDANLDFLSNGFKCRGSTYPSNAGGTNTNIYMAFAENPFVTSTGTPTTAV